MKILFQQTNIFPILLIPLSQQYPSFLITACISSSKILFSLLLLLLLLLLHNFIFLLLLLLHNFIFPPPSPPPPPPQFCFASSSSSSTILFSSSSSSSSSSTILFSLLLLLLLLLLHNFVLPPPPPPQISHLLHSCILPSPPPPPPRWWWRGHPREVWVGVCHWGLQTLTLFKTKSVHFATLFKAKDLFSWPGRNCFREYLFIYIYKWPHRTVQIYTKIVGTIHADRAPRTFTPWSRLSVQNDTLNSGIVHPVSDARPW